MDTPHPPRRALPTRVFLVLGAIASAHAFGATLSHGRVLERPLATPLTPPPLSRRAMSPRPSPSPRHVGVAMRAPVILGIAATRANIAVGAAVLLGATVVAARAMKKPPPPPPAEPEPEPEPLPVAVAEPEPAAAPLVRAESSSAAVAADMMATPAEIIGGLIIGGIVAAVMAKVAIAKSAVGLLLAA
ncbi:hypothetical protein AB1Y20_011560 [Prymnesium parvum]|uniref:Uncharacterized protein n=1 Tax=Prymnesium parvum TaxID=97485 RepID=A0AB34IGA0_PRYPA